MLNRNAGLPFPVEHQVDGLEHQHRRCFLCVQEAPHRQAIGAIQIAHDLAKFKSPGLRRNVQRLPLSGLRAGLAGVGAQFQSLLRWCSSALGQSLAVRDGIWLLFFTPIPDGFTVCRIVKNRHDLALCEVAAAV